MLRKAVLYVLPVIAGAVLGATRLVGFTVVPGKDTGLAWVAFQEQGRQGVFLTRGPGEARCWLRLRLEGGGDKFEARVRGGRPLKVAREGKWLDIYLDDPSSAGSKYF